MFLFDFCVAQTFRPLVLINSIFIFTCDFFPLTMQLAPSVLPLSH